MLDTAHPVRAGVGDLPHQFRIAYARDDSLEHHPHFQSRQVGAQAEVLADTEGAVLVVHVRHALGAGHVELHRVLTKNIFVVIDCVIVQGLIFCLDIYDNMVTSY